MHQATLRTVGGSVMLAVPKPLLEALGLKPNTKVGLRLEAGRLVIEPQTRPGYTLSELLAQCDPEAPLSDEDHAWVTELQVGKEAI